MEIEELLLKEVSNMVLDLYTIEELKKKGIKPMDFKWIFNKNNINVIPVLELYENDQIIKTFESIEFPKRLQKLLREIQIIGDTYNTEFDKHFLSYVEEVAVDCSECEFQSICPFKND